MIIFPRATTVVNDTGGHIFQEIFIDRGKFATVVKDASGQFATNVNYAGWSSCHLSLAPVVNKDNTIRLLAPDSEKKKYSA